MCSDKQRAHLQNIAQLGGLATQSRYGNQYFQELGKAGFQAYADKRFGGDRKAAMNSLVGKGKVIHGKRWHGSVKVNPTQLGG